MKKVFCTLLLLLVLILGACSVEQLNEPAQSGSVQMSATRKEIKSVVTAHRAEILDCYKALSAEPKPEGVVVVQFVIENESVTSAKTLDEQTTLKDKQLHECLLSRFRTWKFALKSADTSTEATYPIQFLNQKN